MIAYAQAILRPASGCHEIETLRLISFGSLKTARVPAPGGLDEVVLGLH